MSEYPIYNHTSLRNFVRTENTKYKNEQRLTNYLQRQVHMYQYR